MTGNQIKYGELQENIRHNQTTEVETNRHNVVTEGETNRHNVVTENETNRHNVETESIGWYDAVSKRISANASMSQAGAAWANVAINQQNADTRKFEAEKNAEINQQNADTKRFSAESEDAARYAHSYNEDRKTTAEIERMQNQNSQGWVKAITDSISAPIKALPLLGG